MEFDIWMLLAGIGILIFGMHIFEQSIKYLGGNRLQIVLQKYTSTTRNAIFTGTWATAILQSSSLLSLLVLAFAGAGVIQLASAVGLMVGANIGTTVSSLIIAKLGFGDFKIAVFALPMIAIGGISLIFVKHERYIYRAKLLVGFGLLFLGLDFMKESVDALRDSFDLAKYGHLSLRSFGVLGIVVTAVVQSSSAVGVMTLAALNAGIITFPASIAIVMGANIGTTVTAVIASLGGESIKRQVALGQVLFNVLLVIIGISFFWQYIWFTNEFLGYADQPVMGNAVLNAIFNISTAILFGFVLVPFTKMIQWIIPAKKKDVVTLHVEQAAVRITDPSFNLPKLYALHEDAKSLIDKVYEYNLYTFGIEAARMFTTEYEYTQAIKEISRRQKETHKQQYYELKHIGNTMLEYLVPLRMEKLGKSDGELVHHIEKAIHFCFRSAKSMKNIYRNLQEIKQSHNSSIEDIYHEILTYSFDLYRNMAMILDREYESEDFEELSISFEKIKGYHKTFLEKITSLLVQKKISDIEISELMNIDHYLLQADKMLIKAIQHVYLSIDEATAFEKLADGDEDYIYQ